MTLLFSTLSRPPEPGSLREVALIYFLQLRDSIEHARLRTVVQTILDPSKSKETFDDYIRLAFPYMETVKKRESEEALQILKEEVAAGPLEIREIPLTRKRSQERTQAPKKESANTRVVDLENIAKINKFQSRFRRYL